MKPYYWESQHGNFGDDLNLWLWDFLLPGFREAHADVLLVGVGTVLNSALLPKDGRKLVLVADRGDRSHLYLFTRDDTQGRWQEQRRIPALPTVFQVGPLMSPSGDRLLFAQSYGRRSGEFFLLDLQPRPNRAWPPACPKRIAR